MSASNIYNQARKLSIFKDFTKEELETFLELADLVEVAANDLVVRQDEIGDCMFVLVAGAASVRHRWEAGEVELAVIGAGDFFGELALIDEGPRSADVVATVSCTLLRVPQGVMRAMAGVYPAAALKLMISVGRVMVRRARANNLKYIDSLHNEEKIAAAK